jgi:hypothetical protein
MDSCPEDFFLKEKSFTWNRQSCFCPTLLTPKSTASWVGLLKMDSHGWFIIRIIGHCHQFHLKILNSVVLENVNHNQFHQLYDIMGSSFTNNISQRGPSLEHFTWGEWAIAMHGRYESPFLLKHWFIVSELCVIVH